MRNEPFRIIFLVALLVPLSGCSTHHEGYVNGTVGINGSVEGPGFDRYVLEIGEGQDPSNWTDLGVSLTADGMSNINESILGMLNTSKLQDGKYTIRLTATDKDGFASRDEVYVTIDNLPDGPTHECPAWTCGNLTPGRNSVDISLPKESYGNNMNCSVRCSCPAGMNMGFKSAGRLEYYYDYLSFGEKNLTGFWNGTESSMSADTDFIFTSDGSVDGNSVMYEYPLEGFKITEVYCSDYCVPRIDKVLGEDGETTHISAVRLNTGESATGFDYYTDGRETFTGLRPGMAYVLYVDVYTENYEPETVLAWADYNRDRDLNDPGETINLTYTDWTGRVKQYAKLLTVPRNATSGPMKLRVAARVGESSTAYSSTGRYSYTPCGVYQNRSSDSKVIEYEYDEVEDYTIEISPTAATTTRSPTTTSTTRIHCDIIGDYPPCGEVTLTEVNYLISFWSDGYASLQQVVTLINAWAS